MDISSDIYEQKLYHMFESHLNTDGFLDINALTRLCKTLELKDKTEILIKCLLNNDKNKNVTFREFKDGLLKFLGSEMTSVNDQIVHNTQENDNEPTIITSATLSTTTTTSQPSSITITTTTIPLSNSITTTSQIISTNMTSSGTNSPLREVQPKFIVGSKKYGRRSRPHNITDMNETSSLSDSDNEQILNANQLKKQQQQQQTQKNVKSQKVQRSVSQSDINGSKRRRPVSGSKLKRCASLPAQQKPKNDMNVIRKLPSQLDSSVDSLATESTLVSSEDIIDMWETAGINHANSLLLSLGFAENQFQISELSTALDDELQTVHGDTGTSPMLRASLILHKAEVNALRQALKQLGAENRKLHADNKDSNRRAVLLAQEIDERHAALENSTNAEIKSLEQRHNELIRELTVQLSTERENWSSLNTRLETRIKLLENDEMKLKNELCLFKDENSALETEQTSLHKQLTEILETNIKLNNEIAEIEEKYKNEENLKNTMENEEVIELIDKISSLQIENSNLRDKNDELSAEIEGLSVELKRIKNKKSSQINRSISSAASQDENDNFINNNNLPPIEIEQNQQLSVAIKRRGDSPSKTRVTEESPRLGKFRKCNNDDNNTGTESETSGEWMALNSELCQTILTTTTAPAPPTNSSTSGFSQDYSSLNDSGRDEDMKHLKNKLEQLEKELDKYKNKTKEISIDENPEEEIEKLKSENNKIETRCNELEYSLEQMRKEYEDCEDYWQSKLNDERVLYEEEQRISDEKFNELLRKMTEYEEQFAAVTEKDGRLSPIEENCRLEQQFSELEAETDEIKKLAEKLLQEKDDEVSKLQFKIKELVKKLNDSDMISQTTPPPPVGTPDMTESPASSPINYLWSQSTIHGPARDYQNPNWNKTFSDIQLDSSTATWNAAINSTMLEEQLPGSITRTVSPIQKPKSIDNNNGSDNCDVASIGSGRSIGSHSVASTYNVHKAELSYCPSPNAMKEDIKRLKVIEIQLREEIKDLCQQRDGIVMELQQLQEAKPAFEKAYARAAHPSLTTRIQQLEQKNRHLQNSLRQQNQYVESIMHQTWNQQRAEINDLRNRLETQNIIIGEQSQRLTNADMLVKDLYVENSHLTATIQRLEQQRNRAGMIQLQQHQQGISGLSGMP